MIRDKINNIVNSILKRKTIYKEIDVETWYYCPKCGSGKIGYCTCLDFKTINDILPKYVQSASCTNCNFKTKWYSDEDDSMLEELIKGTKDINKVF